MAPELFAYKFFDTTEGERKLFGIVNAADMIEDRLRNIPPTQCVAAWAQNGRQPNYIRPTSKAKISE